MIKLIAIVHRKPGLSDQQFYSYWKDTHGPLVARILPGVRRYVQNHFVRVPGVEQQGDGILELWFDNMDALQRYLDWRDSDDAQVLTQDIEQFVDSSKTLRFIAVEHAIL